MRQAYQIRLADLGEHGYSMCLVTSQALRDATRALLDADLARRLEVEDDLMDDLQRELFATLLAPNWRHGVAPAVDIALLARFYERFADHAVLVARGLVYLVTGEFSAQAHLDDEEMDRLHRDIFTMLMDGKWTYGTEAAVDATLVGRYYERFADHAVLVARGLVYLVTGEFSAHE